MLAHHALNELWMDKEGCCPKCCAPCGALQLLDSEGIQDALAIKQLQGPTGGTALRAAAFFVHPQFIQRVMRQHCVCGYSLCHVPLPLRRPTLLLRCWHTLRLVLDRTARCQ